MSADMTATDYVWTTIDYGLERYCLKEYPFGAQKTKLACFDLDGTLIQPKSGYKFAKDDKDWIWISDRIPEILTNLVKQGYRLIICSNQAKFNEIIKKKIEDIVSTLDLVIMVLIIMKVRS